MAWEGAFLIFLQDHVRCGFLTFFAQLLSTIGELGTIWIVLTALLLLKKETRKAAVTCAVSMILTLFVVNCILKPLVARVRPYETFAPALQAVKGWLVDYPGDRSFPSGHAANAFTTAWAMRRTLGKKRGRWALVLAVLISFSRLYVGVHYPTDVFAAVAAGIGCAEIARLLVRRFYPKKRKGGKNGKKES